MKRTPTVGRPFLAFLAYAAGVVAVTGTTGTQARQELRADVAPAGPSRPSRPSDFADIVDAVKSAVIGVRSRGTDNRTGPDRSQAEPPFPKFGPQERSHGAPGGKVLTSQGSGFFISADGYAVTNNHVIEGSATAEVQTDDRKSYTAKVVGTDPASDLALIKIDGRADFPFVKLAEKMPRVGEWVLAIGNPFGLGGTVTAGIVSARERNIGVGTYQDLVQIDAPINKGGSGGPSFDVDGNVIGVNTMIISPSGGSIGIAFAVPAATVKVVIPQLMEKGVVTRGWLGVQIQQVTDPIAQSLGLKKPEGALVAETQADSPAAKAGLASGDVITSIDGDPIKDGHLLVRRIAATAPGTSVKLGVIRKGEERTVVVVLASFPPSARPRSRPRSRR